jgi:glyoxylase-like metal-dependent hydrolase (beta-lactamase superfamily II)
MAENGIESREIAQGIHAIEAPLGERLLRLVLLTGRHGALLIDTGLDSTVPEYIVPYLGTIGLTPQDIHYVLITHCDFDHQGGNVSLRELAPDALFLCHRADQLLVESVDRLIQERYGEFREYGIADSSQTTAWIRANTRSEVNIDVALAGGESIQIDEDWRVEVLHTPGHSLGHISVYDPRSRTAIVADAVLGDGIPTRDGRSALPPTYRYVKQYRNTIRTLDCLDPRTVVTSHFPLLQGAAAREFLHLCAAFCAFFDLFTENLMRSFGAPLTFSRLLRGLAPLGTWPEEARDYLAYPLIGHLEDLRKRNLISKLPNGEWRWNG